MQRELIDVLHQYLLEHAHFAGDSNLIYLIVDLPLHFRHLNQSLIQEQDVRVPYLLGDQFLNRHQIQASYVAYFGSYDHDLVFHHYLLVKLVFVEFDDLLAVSFRNDSICDLVLVSIDLLLVQYFEYLLRRVTPSVHGVHGTDQEFQEELHVAPIPNHKVDVPVLQLQGNTLPRVERKSLQLRIAKHIDVLP